MASKLARISREIGELSELVDRRRRVAASAEEEPDREPV
jgi:hypothetical protein